MNWKLRLTKESGGLGWRMVYRSQGTLPTAEAGKPQAVQKVVKSTQLLITSKGDLLIKPVDLEWLPETVEWIATTMVKNTPPGLDDIGKATDASIAG